MELQIENIFSLELLPHTEAAVEEFHKSSHSPQYAATYTEFRDYWIDPEKKQYSVSANPSMHGAWSTIALAVAFWIAPWIGVLLIPWYVFGIFGALLFQVHYATDMVLGALLGICTLLIARMLFEVSDRKHPTPSRV
jgi:hypothetical protein